MNDINTSFWSKLAHTVQEYLAQSKKKRAHLAELRCLDSKSFEAIEGNHRFILQAEVI